jgi:hypothetical protein
MYSTMYSMLQIRYQSGKVLRGILLALGDQRVRVAIQGSDDVAEYRLISERWVSEDCEVVTMVFDEADLPKAEAEFPDGIVLTGFDRPVARRIM